MWIQILLSIAAAAGAECSLPADVMFLLDTTDSMVPYIEYLKDELESTVSRFNQVFPGSRTGIAEFRDKPYWAAGTETDFCYNLPEGGSLSADHVSTLAAIKKMVPYGGGDLKEDHYQAAVDAALDPKVHWRPIIDSQDKLSKKIRQEIAAGNEKEVKAGDEVATRIIVWLTDSTPQYQGNLAEMNGAPKNLPTNEGTILDGDVSKACLQREFLDPQVFKRIMKEENSFDLLSVHVKDPRDVWKWVNEQLLGQPAEYIVEMDTKPEGLLTQAIDILVEQCPDGALTTEPEETTTQEQTVTTRQLPYIPTPGTTVPPQGRQMTK